MRINLIFGWLCIGSAGVLIIMALVFWLLLGEEYTQLARVAIIVPLNLWYGIRCLKQAKDQKQAEGVYPK